MSARKRKHPKHAHPLVHDKDIAALARSASESHEHELVKICGRALAGNLKARRDCGRYLAATRAHEHEHKAKK